MAGRIEHFASRGAMDIEGLGEQRVQLFQSLGLLADVGDIYRLDFDRLAGSRASARSRSRNLRAAIEASKSRPLANLLVGLNIRHLGSGRRRGAGPALRPPRRASMAALEDELAAVDGVGPIIAASGPGCFAAEPNRAVVEKLRAAGVNLEGPERRRARPRPSPGMSVVVTGTLEGFTRDEVEAAIKARGGKSPGQRVEEDAPRRRRG